MRALEGFLFDLTVTGTATSASALVGTEKEILWEDAAGAATPGSVATVVTRFDFASLTKPFTFTLALVLDHDRTLPLGTRIGDIWPEANTRLGRRTLEDLLRHRSSLTPWAPLYQLCRTRDDVLPLLLSKKMTTEIRPVYGDLDVLLYGLAVEKVTGDPFLRQLRKRVLDPLGMRRVEAAPGEGRNVAWSRMDTDKEVELAAARMGLKVDLQGPPPPGVPQDGNARFLIRLGGLAAAPAHAGLFGTAHDLWRLGAEWLAPRLLLKEEATAAALRGRPFLLGWWRRTLKGSAGRALSPGSFGHTGFAGGSLWIDPERRRVLVLLSHRTEPFGDMNRWRRRFHSLAYDF